MFLEVQNNFIDSDWQIGLRLYYVYSLILFWQALDPVTVNSRLADTLLLRTPTITDKIGIPDKKRRPEGVRYNESWLHFLLESM